MEKSNLDNTTLKKFGITMGIVFLIITLFLLLRHKHNMLSTASVSILFFILALAAPLLLKPIYIFWMKLAFILGWFNTRLILFIIFYLIFTPIGLGMKLLGIDLLDRKTEKKKISYWIKKEIAVFNPLNYQRQF